MASMTGKMMEQQYDGAKYQGKVFHPANNVYFFSCFKYDLSRIFQNTKLNIQQGTRNKEQGTRNKEQGTRNKEQGTDVGQKK